MVQMLQALYSEASSMFGDCCRWSAVQSSEAKHDPSLAKRAPQPAAATADAAGPSKAAEKMKPAATSAAGQIAGIMTGLISADGNPSIASSVTAQHPVTPGSASAAKTCSHGSAVFCNAFHMAVVVICNNHPEGARVMLLIMVA